MKGLFKKRVSAFLLALAMMFSLVPAVSAAASDIAVSVEAGQTITFSRSEFKTIFDAEEAYDDFYYLTFTDYDELDNYGYFTAYDYGGDAVDLDEDGVDNAWFFYYSSDVPQNYDYALSGLTFTAYDNADSGTLYLDFTLVGENEEKVYGILEIEVGSDSSKAIVYEVNAGEKTEFYAEDFYDFFYENYSSSRYPLRYVVFDKPASSDLSDGTLYYNYGKSTEETFTRTSFSNAIFYYDDSTYGDYALDKLSFVADNTLSDDVILTFRAYYSNTRYVDGSVLLEYADDDKQNSDADITYKVDADDEITLNRKDFKALFEETYSGTFSYLCFTDASNLDECGYFTGFAYDEREDEFYDVTLDEDDIADAYFYYYDRDVADDRYSYALDSLTFVAYDDADGETVTLDFTLYGTSSSKKVYGTLAIEIGDKNSQAVLSYYVGNIRYAASTGTNIQINANDIARFYQKSYPSDNLQYVKLTGVPSTGSLYYNYYNASSYGTTSRGQVTAANCSSQVFYANPTSTSQFALTELTYIPYGSNYCAAIPFIAYGTSSRSVSGAILISVSQSAVPEVYGVIPKNTAVSFPASSIYNAVYTATGSAFHSIQLLELPAANVGKVYVGRGTSTQANLLTKYTYAGGSATSMSQLRFVPATGYTGSVSIPYVALNSSGTAIASGEFSLGVVNSAKSFSDVTSSVWCYKYVAELSDANVISGYSDGSFKPNNTISYGAALKLIMLAAGYPEQAPTGSNVFSGYLAKARADGLVTRSNINLSGPITRLQVAQLAASALKLDIHNLSSVKPFTDTADLHVQALNAAGIVEGYFSNGTSTYKPGNTLTRGQVSAIVWRMYNYQK